MAEDQPIDRTKVTFSQAEGLEPLPSPLNLGELSQEVRSLLWHFLHERLESCATYQKYTATKQVDDPWRTILHHHHVIKNHLPTDEFKPNFDHQVEMIKRGIFDGDYNEIFDFLTFLLRHGNCPNEFLNEVRTALEVGRAAYTVIDDGPTIMPAATPEQGEAIRHAFEALGGAGFDGARTHLRNAAQAINAGDLAGSVRESITAVESVARKLDEKAHLTLAPALRAVSEKTNIHSDLMEGFRKIYGYTNDEEGIRHALLDDGAADVDMDDAVFMIGACASFVTYLVGKARRAGLIDN